MAAPLFALGGYSISDCGLTNAGPLVAALAPCAFTNPNSAIRNPRLSGGHGGNRTLVPGFAGRCLRHSATCPCLILGCPTGVEPVLRPPQGRVLNRHTQDTIYLSYFLIFMVGRGGVEPPLPVYQTGVQIPLHHRPFGRESRNRTDDILVPNQARYHYATSLLLNRRCLRASRTK